MSNKQREVEMDMDEAGGGGKHEGWHEHRKCELPIKVDCWCKSDYH